jgi:hypothetical protein
MGDFVSEKEIVQIRDHYDAYMHDSDWQKSDNRAEPESGVRTATTFREVSTWYVNRLLRYIEVQGWISHLEAEDAPTDPAQ